MLYIPLLCIDAGHSDDLHSWSEVSPGRHIFTDIHGAAQFGECTHPLLRGKTAVIVVGHDVSSLQFNNHL